MYNDKEIKSKLKKEDDNMDAKITINITRKDDWVYEVKNIWTIELAHVIHTLNECFKRFNNKEFQYIGSDSKTVYPVYKISKVEILNYVPENEFDFYKKDEIDNEADYQEIIWENDTYYMYLDEFIW